MTGGTDREEMDEDEYEPVTSTDEDLSGTDLVAGIVVTALGALLVVGVVKGFGTIGSLFSRLIKRGGRNGGASGSMSLELMQQQDPNFSEEAFLERVNNMYVQMQNAWTDKE